MRATFSSLAFLCLVPTLVAAATLELTTNGDFELNLDEGWEQAVEGDGGLGTGASRW